MLPAAKNRKVFRRLVRFCDESPAVRVVPVFGANYDLDGCFSGWSLSFQELSCALFSLALAYK